ncbi:MAG: hypothetical protein ABIK43_02450 [candidate division WOR-3 bacterium]
MRNLEKVVYFSSIFEPRGVFLPKSRARVASTDRGFMLGYGVYEVIRSYGGRLFKVCEHLALLSHSLAAVRIACSKPERLVHVARELIRRNQLLEAHAVVYVQVTRGVPERQLRFPNQTVPSGRGDIRP